MSLHKFLRSKDRPVDTDIVPGYDGQVLFNGEAAHVVGSTIRPGFGGPEQHMHQYSDQIYYVLRGKTTITLGDEEFEVNANELIYIPKNTPHHNINHGDSDEFHYEVIAPSPGIREEILTFTDSTELGPKKPFIKKLSDIEWEEPLPGFRTARILRRKDGSDIIGLYMGEVDPGSGGPDWHIHRFEQFYYVLEGELTVEVALETFVASAGDLVFLPAGVPHRQRNEGATTERHLVTLLPEPEAGEEWDIPVAFAPGQKVG